MFSTCATEREGSTFLINVTGLLSFISTVFTSSNVPPYTDNNQLHNGIVSSRAILSQVGEQKMKNGMKKEEIERIIYISRAHYIYYYRKKKRHKLSENGAKEDTLLTTILIITNYMFDCHFVL